jgi:hypothetical protein
MIDGRYLQTLHLPITHAIMTTKTPPGGVPPGVDPKLWNTDYVNET